MKFIASWISKPARTSATPSSPSRMWDSAEDDREMVRVYLYTGPYV